MIIADGASSGIPVLTSRPTIKALTIRMRPERNKLSQDLTSPCPSPYPFPCLVIIRMMKGVGCLEWTRQDAIMRAETNWAGPTLTLGLTLRALSLLWSTNVFTASFSSSGIPLRISRRISGSFSTAFRRDEFWSMSSRRTARAFASGFQSPDPRSSQPFSS